MSDINLQLAETYERLAQLHRQLANEAAGDAQQLAGRTLDVYEVAEAMGVDRVTVARHAKNQKQLRGYFVGRVGHNRYRLTPVPVQVPTRKRATWERRKELIEANQ